MPYETEYREKDGGVITTYWGSVTDNDIIESGQNKLALIEKLKTYRYALTDLSRVDHFNLTSIGIQTNVNAASEIIRQNKDLIVAFVLPTDVEYGMGRMWQAHADVYGIKSCVCRTRAEADAWINANLK